MSPPSASIPVVVFTGDANYGLPMAAALQSLLDNLAGTAAVEVIVLHPGLPVPTQNRLRRVAARSALDVRLSFVRVDEDRHLNGLDLHLHPSWTNTIFYRPLLDVLLPARHRRVLYLDADTIVEGNVMDLWTADMADHTVLAVQERTVSCPLLGIARWRALGFDADAPYFNSGVMLIDRARWRARRVGERTLDYLHRHGATLNLKGNQEGLNVALAGHWGALDPRWNVVHSFYYPEDWASIAGQLAVEAPALITRDARIVHFTSKRKPWRPEGYGHPARTRFWHYLRRSGWLSSLAYAVRRGRVGLEGTVLRLTAASRPLRHRMGLRRRPPPAGPDRSS